MISPLQIVDDMLHAYEDVRSALNEAQTTLDYCEKEHNDLIHALELVNFNASEGYRLAKQMQENRQRRREAKDTIELLKPSTLRLNRRLVHSISGRIVYGCGRICKTNLIGRGDRRWHGKRINRTTLITQSL